MKKKEGKKINLKITHMHGRFFRNHFMVGTNFGVLRCLLLELDYYYFIKNSFM